MIAPINSARGTAVIGSSASNIRLKKRLYSGRIPAKGVLIENGFLDVSWLISTGFFFILSSQIRFIVISAESPIQFYCLTIILDYDLYRHIKKLTYDNWRTLGLHFSLLVHAVRAGHLATYMIWFGC